MEIKAKSAKPVLPTLKPTVVGDTEEVEQEVKSIKVIPTDSEGNFTSFPTKEAQLEHAEMERKALKTQIFLNLIQAKASTGTWDHGTLPDNKTLLRDLNHIKGIAEIAATVITTESEVKPAGR